MIKKPAGETPDRYLTGTPVGEGIQEVEQEEPQVEPQEKPQEPDRQEPQELGKSEPKTVDGFMCVKCGAPVTQLSSGAYRCTRDGKLTSIVPIKPLEPFTSEKKPAEPLSTRPEEQAPKPFEPPMPPELQFSEHVSERLATELRQVYGITEQQAVYIARTVKDNPQLAQNPNYLAYHIKQLAAKANDYQLQYVLTGIYERMKAEGIPGAQSVPPIQFSIPAQPQYAGYPPPFVQQPSGYYNPYQVCPQHPQGNPYMNPQGQGNLMPTREDMAKALKDQREEFQRVIDERDKRDKEERDKSALMQTLNNVNKALDNLNTRVSDIEKGGVPKKPSEENSFNKTILEAIGKDISDRITGVKGELTPDQIRLVVGDEVKKHFPSSPSGTRNQFDMEVEKAQHEARARMMEAEEKRKGYEAISGGIRDGLQGLGWNIGAGASGGTPKESSSVPKTKTETPAAEPQTMEWKGGLWQTNCPFNDCRAPLTFEDGKSTVMCPSCNRVIRVQPTEEELGQKSGEEAKTELATIETPTIKTEVKLEKPEGGE